MKKAIQTFLLLLLSLTGFHVPQTAAQTALPQDDSAAVILAYHRIGEDLYPESNIRIEQFESHIRALTQGDYHVLPLPTLIAAWKEGDTLQPLSIALTFDGAHRSFYDHALPLLLAEKLPFTLFLPTDHLDASLPNYMSWKEIKKLLRHKNISIGIHPASYTRLNGKEKSEIRRQINKSLTRVREETGTQAAFFAYPFGEFSADYRNIIAEQGFSAAFSQQSGVAYAAHDKNTLPRFPMTERYAGLDRFRLIARAMPLPVTDTAPADPYLDTPQPAIGFTIDKKLSGELNNLSCFIAGQTAPTVEKISKNRIEIRLQAPLVAERNRMNCTMPAPPVEGSHDPRWRWFGALFTLQP